MRTIISSFYLVLSLRSIVFARSVVWSVDRAKSVRNCENKAVAVRESKMKNERWQNVPQSACLHREFTAILCFCGISITRFGARSNSNTFSKAKIHKCNRNSTAEKGGKSESETISTAKLPNTLTRTERESGTAVCTPNGIEAFASGIYTGPQFTI